MKFIEKSYTRHKDHQNQYLNGGGLENHALTWIQDDTVDAWRHNRMYNTIDVLLNNYPNAEWLTVGDSRYASDANYIYKKGLHVVATNISEHLLPEAKELGRIPEYKQENAENLSFEDEKFDFVLCKESYHHFPRPMIALYEMLRVAKKGVVLIEPNDPCIFCYNPSQIWNVIQKNNDYEKIGNYKYTISPREMIKVSLGLNLYTVAFKELNDHYIQGVEYEKATENSELFKKIKEEIEKIDKFSDENHRPYALLTAIIFKEQPDQKTCNDLSDQGFKVINLPRNPYIDEYSTVLKS